MSMGPTLMICSMMRLKVGYFIRHLVSHVGEQMLHSSSQLWSWPLFGHQWFQGRSPNPKHQLKELWWENPLCTLSHLLTCINFEINGMDNTLIFNAELILLKVLMFFIMGHIVLTNQCIVGTTNSILYPISSWWERHGKEPRHVYLCHHLSTCSSSIGLPPGKLTIRIWGMYWSSAHRERNARFNKSKSWRFPWRQLSSKCPFTWSSKILLARFVHLAENSTTVVITTIGIWQKLSKSRLKLNKTNMMEIAPRPKLPVKFYGYFTEFYGYFTVFYVYGILRFHNPRYFISVTR